MNELQMFFYLLSLVGLGFVLAYGTIFDELKTHFYVWGIALYPKETNPIRNIIIAKAFDFVCCPMCMGVWIGWTASLAYKPFIHWFLDGFLIGGVCYILDHGEDSPK